MNKEDILTIQENEGDDSITIEILKDDSLNEIEGKLYENAKNIDGLDKKIDNLTNQADLLDYSVAIGSGVISGLIDAFFVGEFSLDNAKKWGEEVIEKKIMDESNAKNLKNAAKRLEKAHLSVGDQASSSFGNQNHHFYDFTHHKSPLGLIASIISQFTGVVYGIDPKTGMIKGVSVPNFQSALEGKNIFEKITNAIINWNGHLLSDMAGSSNSIAKGNRGSGILGPIGSSLVEFSSLPIFRDKNGRNEFNERLSKAFIEKQLDYRTEKGIIHETSKQFLPVVVNELLVRFYYSIRQLTKIIKEKKIKKFSDIDFDTIKEVVFPNNRTINRMLTISTGVMTAIDLSDAMLRSKGTVAGFALRINYVGLGRFSFALTKDCIKGLQKSISIKERIELINERNNLLNKKTYILNEGNRIQLDNNEKEIKQIEDIINNVSPKIRTIHHENNNDLNNISSSVDEIKDKNEDLLDDMKDILDW